MFKFWDCVLGTDHFPWASLNHCIILLSKQCPKDTECPRNWSTNVGEMFKFCGHVLGTDHIEWHPSTIVGEMFMFCGYILGTDHVQGHPSTIV